MKKVSILALTCVAGLLVACSSVPRGVEQGVNVANTSWTMIEWTGAQGNEVNGLLKNAPKKVTLTFSSDEAKGVSGKVRTNAGCNNAVGQYAQQNMRVVSFGHLASTRMMCASDVMKIEHALFQKLSGQNFEKSIRTTAAGDTLTLKSKEGEELIFLKQDIN